MLIALTHETTYQFSKSVKLSPHIIRLHPAPYCKLPIQAYSLTIEPQQHFINWQHDSTGNQIANVNFLEATDQLKITVDLIFNKVSINPFDFYLDTKSLTYPLQYTSITKKILQPYLNYDYYAELECWYNSNKIDSNNSLDFLVELNSSIQRYFKYQLRLEPGIQTPVETLAKGSGSCRDLAWFQCILLRHLGFASRFVSGYLIQLINKDENPDVTKDTLELHAWCEVFLPGAGWIGFDPTSGLLAADNHIPLCAAAIPSETAAISGLISPCESLLDYQMTLRRISKPNFDCNNPLSHKQWQDLNEVAKHVDQCLVERNIDFTMGGEPTYVYSKNLDDIQWQTGALGAEKFKLGIAVNRDLQCEFAPQGIPFLSQGKWYPGEKLPRWACQSYWRKDKEPLWINQDRFDIDASSSYTQEDSQRLLIKIANYLGLPTNCIQPVYEDAVYQLWLIGKLGKRVDFSQHRLKSHDYQTLSQTLFTDNLGEPVGICLPLAFQPELSSWVSCQLQVIASAISAIPGESSLGYRLPLDKLATQFESELNDQPEQSSFETQELPTHQQITAKLREGHHKGILIDQFVRSMLCIEIRDNILYIFIPPIKPLSAYCELLAAIEMSVETLNLTVRLEGYGPPKENQLSEFSVTPDPGVLEINIQPAASWQEIVSIQQILSKVTTKHHLQAHKYTLDGRKIATGGGCHITLGASTPENSLFLQQPEILQSMLTFWQHHPSLSYLFSGLFIGPTSQAPRIDEARHDSLYELELAFKQMPKGKVENYWLLDRLLRHLLVDLTGNTHRAEFCIDKLFSPSHQAGRQGLVELRAFEMQPHPQLNCLQLLLVRTLITIFIQQSYHQKLHRWGTELHDRFMLPHFIWQDFSKVIEYISLAGYKVELAWFNELFNYRFPKVGSTNIQGIELELRQALEPWPALGQEFERDQTSRLVDTSLNRLQITCTGINPEKTVVVCNGIEIPLQKTGVNGKYIAAIRFKTWSFTQCLHPNLPAVSHLTFDVIDRQLQRSLGGCKYFLQHPGGKNPATLPINQREADTRQRARFVPFGHSPGHVNIQQVVANPEYPYTLDLRLS